MLSRTVILASIVTLGTAQAQSGSIAGRILNKETGAPIRKAVINLSWLGPPRSYAVAISDGAGRFVFDLLPPGRYEMRATKDGFGHVAYGAEQSMQMGQVFTLAAGENKTGMDFKLP